MKVFSWVFTFFKVFGYHCFQTKTRGVTKYKILLLSWNVSFFILDTFKMPLKACYHSAFVNLPITNKSQKSNFKISKFIFLGIISKLSVFAILG